MGAAIAIQAGAIVPHLCAVAGEDSFATFREIALDRISQTTHVSEWLAHTTGISALEFGLLYARIRYGVNLFDANPLHAIRDSRVPMLLICGTDDTNIPMRHSIALMRSGGSHTELWVVEGAQHTGAVSVDPFEFERRVVGWFEAHQTPQ